MLIRSSAAPNCPCYPRSGAKFLPSKATVIASVAIVTVRIAGEGSGPGIRRRV